MQSCRGHIGAEAVNADTANDARRLIRAGVWPFRSSDREVNARASVAGPPDRRRVAPLPVAAAEARSIVKTAEVP